MIIHIMFTIGTEVYMGEAGQDMYIDTIGTYIWCSYRRDE